MRSRRPRSSRRATMAVSIIRRPRPRRRRRRGTSISASCSFPASTPIYGDAEARLESLAKPAVPRVEVVDELYDAIVHRRPPLHDGRWAMATLEVCLAILESAGDQI